MPTLQVTRHRHQYLCHRDYRHNNIPLEVFADTGNTFLQEVDRSHNHLGNIGFGCYMAHFRGSSDFQLAHRSHLVAVVGDLATVSRTPPVGCFGCMNSGDCPPRWRLVVVIEYRDQHPDELGRREVGPTKNIVILRLHVPYMMING